MNAQTLCRVIAWSTGALLLVVAESAAAQDEPLRFEAAAQPLAEARQDAARPAPLGPVGEPPEIQDLPEPETAKEAVAAPPLVSELRWQPVPVVPGLSLAEN